MVGYFELNDDQCWVKEEVKQKLENKKFVKMQNASYKFCHTFFLRNFNSVTLYLKIKLSNDSLVQLREKKIMYD